MGTWDVIVVGSRIAGASTALLLARAGLRVLVLERARRGSDTLSTHALMRAGVLQLSRWGVLDEVVRGTPPVRRTLFHYYDEDPVTVSSRPSPGVPALYAPRRTVLDTVLADAAERAGATVRHGTAVTGVLRDEHGRVTGVRTRRRGGPDGAERAPLVVGADGLRSAVADAVGAPVLWRGEAATNVLYGYVTDLPAAGYEWYYGAGVGAGLIPTHDGLTCVFAGTTRTELDRLLATVPPAVALTLLARRLPDLVERLTAGGQWSPVRVVRGVPGFLRQAYGPGWALVGDAGFWKDPLSTHGMTDALRDAELLARAVVAGREGSAALTAALADYQQIRDRLSRPMIEVVELLASMTWDRTRVRQLLRHLASTMVEEVETLETMAPWPPVAPTPVHRAGTRPLGAPVG